jgi:hypothetical protein
MNGDKPSTRFSHAQRSYLHTVITIAEGAYARTWDARGLRVCFSQTRSRTSRTFRAAAAGASIRAAIHVTPSAASATMAAM